MSSAGHSECFVAAGGGVVAEGLEVVAAGAAVEEFAVEVVVWECVAAGVDPFALFGEAVVRRWAVVRGVLGLGAANWIWLPFVEFAVWPLSLRERGGRDELVLSERIGG